MTSTMHMSSAGRRMLETFEGFRGEAYHDQRFILTIGYGHTASAPSRITFDKNSVWTREWADTVLSRDLANFEEQLENNLDRVPTQAQFDAMLSLEYNIGMGGFETSSIHTFFNAGLSLQRIANAFLLWDHPSSLLARRQKEAHLFLTGDYPS